MEHTTYTNDIFSKGLRKVSLQDKAETMEVARLFAEGPETSKLDHILFVLGSVTYKMGA